jgi:small-conductance mechanosensitive channel
METLHLNISTGALLTVLLIGALIFLGFRMILYLLNRLLLPRQGWLRRVVRLMPPIEGVVWVLFTAWSFLRVLEDTRLGVLGALMTGLTFFIWFAWFALRDFVAGIIIRAEGLAAPQETIRVEGQEGRIQHLGFRSLRMINQEGNLVSLPYHRLIKEARVHSRQRSQALTHQAQAVLAAPTDFREARQHLLKVLMSAPWVSVKYPPEIVLEREADGNCFFQIKTLVLSHEHGRLLDHYLERALQERTEGTKKAASS